MKIGVSACLLGVNCKYNGGNNFSAKLEDLLEGHEVVPLCPEVMGGLSTPRVPAELVEDEVMNREGRSVDEAFRRGAEIALRRVLEKDVELVILQSRSPSCGVKEVYDGSFFGKLIPGKGVFAARLEEAGISAMDVEDVDEFTLKGER